jgi:hypothetical protein
MTRFFSITAAIAVIIVSISACSNAARVEQQVTPVGPTSSPTKELASNAQLIGADKVLFAGTFNRETKVLQISYGLPEPRTFENIETGFKALEEAGYERVGLQRLRAILEKEIEKDPIALAVEDLLDPSDVFAAFEITGSLATFTIFDIDLSKYSKAAEVSNVIEKNAQQGGCERISKSCVRCPNGKIYCLIENVKRIGDRK